MLVQAHGGPMFRVLGKQKRLSQSLINVILFLFISGDKTIQMVIYEAKNGNLKRLCLTL